MASGKNSTSKTSTKSTIYRSTLDKDASERYTERLKLIQVDVCPFEVPLIDWKDDVKLWPQTEFPDLCMYLLDTPGIFTTEKLKTYKSLEAYNYFSSGYVRTCMYLSINTNFCIIKACVNPSQRTSDDPHEAWVAINKKDGSIVTAHCKCMAGLGETCSHVAAILFKIEAANRLGYTKDACTSEPCVWNQTFTKKVQPEAIVSVDFKRPKRGKAVATPTTPKTPRPRSATVNHEPSSEEIDRFMAAMHNIPNVCVNILSTVPEYRKEFEQIPEVNPNLPAPMTSLKTTDAPMDAYKAYQLTREECDFLEQSTLQQSSCKLWSVHREGRITASIIHSVLHTNQEHPSKTVMETIFGERQIFSKCAATEWGTTHEETARNSYANFQSGVHKDFECRASGLVIDPDVPHIAASPDGWVSCECCGKGVLEIKCPYKYRDVNPADFETTTKKDKMFCLKFSDGKVSMRKEHQYHLQVQTQMHVTGAAYCDFVVWTNQGFIVLRIVKDSDLMLGVRATIDKFFFKHCLPKLCGVPPVSTESSEPLVPSKAKKTTGRKKTPTTVLQPKDQNKMYCLCKSPDDGSERMVACDGDSCVQEWFHFRCVGLKRAPRGQWFCAQCRR